MDNEGAREELRRPLVECVGQEHLCDRDYPRGVENLAVGAVFGDHLRDR